MMLHACERLAPSALLAWALLGPPRVQERGPQTPAPPVAAPRAAPAPPPGIVDAIATARIDTSVDYTMRFVRERTDTQFAVALLPLRAAPSPRRAP